MLEKEHVPTALNLSKVAQECCTECWARWHRHAHHFAPALWRVDGSTAHGWRAPVVTDDDGMFVATQGIVQGIGIAGQRRSLVNTRFWHARRGVATHKGGYCSVTACSKHRQQMSPGVGRVRKAMQAQRQRA